MATARHPILYKSRLLPLPGSLVQLLGLPTVVTFIITTDSSPLPAAATTTTPATAHRHIIRSPAQSSALPAIIHTDDAATKLSDRVRRRCFNCCTTDTSTWRRSNLSPGKVLCNKCGLFERTHSRPRPEQFPHKRGPLASSALRRSPPGAGGPGGMGVNDHHHHHHHLPPIHYNNNNPTNTNSVAPNNNYPHPHTQLGHSTSTSTLPPINQPRILPGVQSWLNEPALPPLSHSPHSLSHPHPHQRPASASLGLSDSRRSLPTSLLPSLSNSSSSSSAPPTRLHSPPTSASTAPSTQPQSHPHSNGDPPNSNSYVSSTTASPLLPGTPLLNASTPTNNHTNNNNNPNPENSLSNGETV
ncbi:hypothetical protein ONZ45_g12334 [Pleurotus djamor]|nr:hypothetical protein ONZ45_g12334 [Pleurotus djamor]